MRWVPTEAALPGPYFVTFRATDSDGLFTEQTIEIALSATPVEGSLSADVGTTPGFVDLSNEGLLDWVHVGLNARNDQNRKSGVSRSITGLSVFNGINRRFSSTKRPSYGWTDGTPEAAAVTHAGIYTPSKSFNVYAPADGNERTLTVYLGGFKAQGQISVRLSDGSAPAFVTTVEDLNGAFDRALRITYRAGTPGQHTLVVEYNYLSGTNITMQAATLQ
ncbi:MAG: hypothetical protein DHS20C16_35660 [Phycisphaerae bacterium]|nr:MAG: hypothetical protein DHS20C16_35660 [Phycisphaerae bacterium]